MEPAQEAIHVTRPIPTPQERRQALEAQYPVWPRHTFASHFHVQCQRYAERPFLITPDAKFTYAQVWQEAWRIAKSLLSLGVRRRQHVAVLMANDPEFVFTAIAISLVGAVCIPINTMLREDELAYILEQSDTNWLLMHQTASGIRHADAVARILAHRPIGPDKMMKGVVCIPNFAGAGGSNEASPLPDGFEPWADFLARADRVSDDEVTARWRASEYPDEVAYIIYTSGSTGLPKGVMLTHDMFLRCAYSTCLSRAIEDGRRIFTALPMYHVFAFEEGLLAASFVGGCVITCRDFSPLLSLQLMERYEANDFLCVPSMLVAIVNHPEVRNFHLPHLFALMCAAAPAPVPVWERAVEVLGVTEICTAYGGTEVTASTVHTEVGDPIEIVVTRVGRIKPAGVTGLPEFGGANVEYKVIDPHTLEDLPPGSVGELCARGNTVTRGYYNNPEETALAIDKDGWFRTGDLGRIHPDGYFEFLGRSKDVYKVSGENVAPKEVEDVITKHPKVAQAYVVGVPDKLTTETGAAFIELKPGETCTRREIIHWCLERLAKFKVPRHVWFMQPDEWPMTGTRKIQKFKLKEMAIERLSNKDMVEEELDA